MTKRSALVLSGGGVVGGAWMVARSSHAGMAVTSMAPTIAPADVPMTWSALPGSHPVSLAIACSAPVSGLLRRHEIAELFADLPRAPTERVRRPLTDPARWPEELFPPVYAAVKRPA